jgi:CRP-like cAMP-binding protein/anti-anti-sigma regulatory factor
MYCVVFVLLFVLIHTIVSIAPLRTALYRSKYSLMHVPINIPSLSISTHREVDMNKELVAHGYSNLLSGMFGGLQNYLCYSNSLLYFKCNGGGQVSGYLMSAVVAVMFWVGPSVVYFMPRVMPGCLLIQIGIDLTVEALYDSAGAFDIIEYSSIVAITVVMTFYGMTAGLGLGVLCAAFTFTLQASAHVDPIHRSASGRTLRSSRWRTRRETGILEDRTGQIAVLQLKGHLFFGNATLIAAEVDKMLLHSYHNDDVWFIILDFTLVVGIDASAAETLLKIFKKCRDSNVRLCYSGGGETGLPCTFPLTEQIAVLDTHTIQIPFVICSKCGASFTLIDGRCTACKKAETCKRSKWVCQTINLNRALAWCEDIIIAEEPTRPIKKANSFSQNINDNLIPQQQQAALSSSDNTRRTVKPSLQRQSGNTGVVVTRDTPKHLHQIYNICSNESRATMDKLLSYFVTDHAAKGAVLWHYGQISDRALLLVRGRLQHELTEQDRGSSSSSSSSSSSESATSTRLTSAGSSAGGVYSTASISAKQDSGNDFSRHRPGTTTGTATAITTTATATSAAAPRPLPPPGHAQHSGSKEKARGIHPGHLVGEYGLLNHERRLGTLVATEDCELLVLHREGLDRMIQEDPYLCFVLTKIGMVSAPIQRVVRS